MDFFVSRNPDSAVKKNHHLRKLTNSGIVCWGRYPYLSLPLPILLYVLFISIREFLEAKLQPIAFKEGWTPLHIAALNGNLEAWRWDDFPAPERFSNFLPFKEWKIDIYRPCSRKRCNNKWNWIMKFDVHLSIFFWGGRGSGCSKTGTFIANPDVTTGILRTTHPPENSHMKQEGLKGQAVGNPQSLLLLVIFWGGIVCDSHEFLLVVYRWSSFWYGLLMALEKGNWFAGE